MYQAFLFFPFSLLKTKNNKKKKHAWSQLKKYSANAPSQDNIKIAFSCNSSKMGADVYLWNWLGQNF